jgi:hypothetical protein
MTYVSAISLTWMHETRRDRFVFPQTRNFGRLSDDCEVNPAAPYGPRSQLRIDRGPIWK